MKKGVLHSQPMLKMLNISNLAVVTKLQVEFSAGLNLLTGETGSGKSIIVDALGVLLGGRGSQDIIRSGEQKAYVEGYFQVVGHKQFFEVIEKAGIESEEGELVIRREISTSGRSRAFINDQLITISLLRELRPFLVDIHGQGEQQTLLYADSHIDLLDLFAGFEPDRQQIAKLYQEWQAVTRSLAQLRQDEADRLRSLDILEFQTQEIERAALQEGEDAQLDAERRLLVNAERLTTLSTQCYHLLYENESAALAQLSTVARRLEELAQLDQRFSPYLEQLNNVRYTLEDLTYFLRDYIDNIHFSPQRLKEIEDRLIEIDRLKRKYGGALPAVLKTLADMQADLARLQQFDLQEQELKALCEQAQTAYRQLAERLSQRRRAEARKLEEAVIAELQHLAMEQTQFIINFFNTVTPQTSERGIDTVEFLVSANVGEELRPLVKIASGGEISRLMLALKTITAPTEYPRTLVFDEVDVGIGGRVATAVGQRLKRLSHSNQVLCVTHQPQIARFADTHYRVEKRVVAERTEVIIEKLDIKGRVEELARMMGGKEITPLTRQHAAELLVEQ